MSFVIYIQRDGKKYTRDQGGWAVNLSVLEDRLTCPSHNPHTVGDNNKNVIKY